MSDVTSITNSALKRSYEFVHSYLDERALEQGKSVIADPLPCEGFIPTPGFMFVNHNKAGDPIPDRSNCRYDTEDKKARFRCQKGAGNAIYAPLPDSWRKFKAASRKYIVEGNAQTGALTQLGLPAVGIRGIHNWHLKGRRDLHPDLAQEIGYLDEVIVVPDADWRTNPEVHNALFLFVAALQGHCKRVYIVEVTSVPGVDNSGIDDVIAMWRRSGKEPLDMFEHLKHLPSEELPIPTKMAEVEPLVISKMLMDLYYREEGDQTLLHHQKVFYRWNTTHWHEVEEQTVKRDVMTMLDSFQTPKITPHKIGQVVELTKNNAFQEELAAMHTWMRPGDYPDPRYLLSCENGILDVRSGTLHEHTPHFFTLNATRIRYDPDATCPRWLKFMDEVYAKDPDARLAMQMLFGYLITHDTSQQKAFMMIGEKRSGKGTIARVLTMLLGEKNCCSPTLANIGEQYGMQDMIGKTLAVFSDIRMGTRNAQTAVENIMRVTGEDYVTIMRKYHGGWTGRLDTRILIIGNVTPRAEDVSGAFVSRMIYLPHRTSFYGREQTDLTEVLASELPGILNWAVEGYRLLQEAGSFPQPEHGREMLQHMERANNHVLQYVEDNCVVDSSMWTAKTELLRNYEGWCITNGIQKPHDMAGLASVLYSLGQGIESKKRGPRGKQQQAFVGLGVKVQSRSMA